MRDSRNVFYDTVNNLIQVNPFSSFHKPTFSLGGIEVVSISDTHHLHKGAKCLEESKLGGIGKMPSRIEKKMTPHRYYTDY